MSRQPVLDEDPPLVVGGIAVFTDTLGSVSQQVFGNCRFAIPDGDEERRPASSRLRFWIGAGSEETPDFGKIAPIHRPVQGRYSLIRSGVLQALAEEHRLQAST
jgi:hypothetical protein